MTKRTTNTTESAKQAHARLITETREMLKLLEAALDREAKETEAAHWGHVGSLGEVKNQLKHACSWAGVQGYEEE